MIRGLVNRRFLWVLAVLLFSTSARSATFTVVSTADSGVGSFRQAILDANATAGADTIHFNVAPGGHVVVAPASQLPAIVDAVTIDGTSQPGFAGAPIVELTGSGAVSDGIVIDASSVTIRGLIINRFTGRGIYVHATAAQNSIEVVGNYIGTDATGLVAAANAFGVDVAGVSPATTVDGVTIGSSAPGDRNVIAGNGTQVKCVFARSVSIAGNYIGLGVDGSTPLGGLSGVSMGSADGTIGGTIAADRNVIGGTSIGIELDAGGIRNIRGNYIGTDATGLNARPNSTGILMDHVSDVGFVSRNVISGNTSDAIRIFDTTTNATITANFIGTDPTGTIAVPNGGDGIDISQTSTGITIGLQTLGNVISGNGGFGVRLSGAASNATLSGNKIGTNAAGTAAIPNALGGILVLGSSSAIVGSSSVSGNVISGNGGDGIVLDSSVSCTVRGNIIGLDAAASAAVPNAGYGIDMPLSSSSRIGGSNPGEGNIIAGNAGGAGIGVGTSSVSGLILGNSIYDNATLGIDLGIDGVTPNDNGDADSGANTLQNYPVLTSATSGAAGTRILGTLNSTPSTTFRIEFFSNTTADQSGFGEGRQFAGFTNVTTDAGGNATIDVTLPTLTGPFVSSTASASSTSEFSNNVAITVITAEIPTVNPAVILLIGMALAATALWRLHS
jgi:parallel beta-helix repeat protein